MRASVIEGFRVFLLREELFSSLKSLGNKWWVKRVPAICEVSQECEFIYALLHGLEAAVIPVPRVVTMFIGFKVFVAGLISSQ